MEFEALAYLTLMAVGFGIAALASATFSLATGRPLGFALGRVGSSPLAIAAILLRLLAGPAILVRNAVASGMSLRSDPVWLVAGLLVAGVWALTSGALILQALGASG